MTLRSVRVDVLAERARAAGLDGTDRGAVRRLVWYEVGTDAIDHEVVEQVADRLSRRPA
ncbi:MAG TPA: hypothetical protein VGM69_14600 [Chloroflexota bacterium]|jgi:hypothetical protein